MRLALLPHVDSPPPEGLAVSCEAARGAGGRLTLGYRISGPLAAIVLPPPGGGVRTDGLWRTTCLEAFVGGEGEAYHEFNFAPSGDWAAYAFAARRSGRTDAEIPAPRIVVTCDAEVWEMRIDLDLRPLAARPWRVGLTAVIEAADGGLSYWALAHPAGAPDFHDPAGFVVQLLETA